MSAVSELRPLLERLRATCVANGAPGDIVADLDRLSRRLDEPLIVALAGKVKAGKSTLLNALIGEELAPTDAGECTQVVTVYRNGHTYRVAIELNDGTTRQVPFRRDDGALEIDFGSTPLEQVAKIIVDWPSSKLVGMTLIDTPGLDSIATGTSDRTQRFLGTDDEGGGEADAVIYLMRHVHRTDLGFLEAFRDEAQAGASPISAIAVLSRADEVGACRVDAMASAQRIADSWRRDPRLRRLVQTVVPVAGLVAQMGATLREDEYRALATIATLPRKEADALLLTTDRFVNDLSCQVTQLDREDLLARLGVFGVRLCVSLIRLGAAPSASALATELANRSGVVAFRELLTTVLTERRDVLKARVALSGMDAALMRMPGAAFDPIRNELERIQASAHEFEEVHLLNAIRSGVMNFRPAEIEELERLLSSIGAPRHVRLGVDQTTSEAQMHQMILDGVNRWRRRSENPMTPLDLAGAARSVARTYEGLLSVAG
jgi:hypothetical protein